jgi:hypothetical protein
MFGLLHLGNDALIPYIIRLYARTTRKARGMTQTFGVAEAFKETFCRDCRLHFVGVWDTVSSAGWIWNPVWLPFTGQNPAIANGRQAISIDERRCYFREKLWGAPLPGQNMKQVWFAGVHADVGGSCTDLQSGLSQIALEWMLCEAASFGLLVDARKAQKVLGRIAPPPPVAPNPAAKTNNSLTWKWWILEFLPHSYYDLAALRKKWRIPLGARRKIPQGSVLHESVIEKLHVDNTYHPPNLPTQPWAEEPGNSLQIFLRGEDAFCTAAERPPTAGLAL